MYYQEGSHARQKLDETNIECCIGRNQFGQLSWRKLQGFHQSHHEGNVHRAGAADAPPSEPSLCKDELMKAHSRLESLVPMQWGAQRSSKCEKPTMVILVSERWRYQSFELGTITCSES